MRTAFPLLALSACLLPSGAEAHSELRRSSPENGARLSAPPAALVLHFNERVQVTAFRLFNAGGEEVALPRPRATQAVEVHQVAAPALAPGGYRVEWRIISADGHPVGGVIRFSIASP